MSDPTDAHPGLVQWLAAGRRGASSNAIVAHLTGLAACDGAYPHDADDFCRCEALLDAVPSLRPLLPRMAEVNAYWAALMPNWDAMRGHDPATRNALLKSKLRPIEDADPDHARMGPSASIRFGGVIGFKGASPDDDQFNTAVMAVWESGGVSTSFIQRRLGIGYNAAARLIERMEHLGIVSKANHVGKREVRSPEDLRAGMETIDKAVNAAGGDEKLAGVVLKTIIAAMKEKDAQNRVKAGKPRMKPDPTFDAAANNAYAVTASELRQFIERYEQLEAEKKDLTDQQKEVMAEAKGRGYDTKVMKKIMALRKRKPDDIAEEQAVLDLYLAALGM